MLCLQQVAGITYTGHPILVDMLLLGMTDDVPIAQNPEGSTPGEYSYRTLVTSLSPKVII